MLLVVEGVDMTKRFSITPSKMSDLRIFLPKKLEIIMLLNQRDYGNKNFTNMP
jgi:hypothetical protein